MYQTLVASRVVIFAFSRPRPGVDCYVVHVDCYASPVNQVAEYCVHHRLERCWRVSEPKEHYCWFIEPFVSDERGFPLVLQFNEHFVIPPFDIDAGELCTVT